MNTLHGAHRWQKSYKLAIVVVFLAIFAFWRVDNARVQRIQLVVVNSFYEVAAILTYPVKIVDFLVGNFRDFSRLYVENERLLDEIQQLSEWKNRTHSLEQENAQLRALNNVKVPQNVTYVSGEVIANSESAFSHSLVINVGLQDRVRDGNVVIDSYGVVGRIFGVANQAARVLLLSDINSRIPVRILPGGKKGILEGQNAPRQQLKFLDTLNGIEVGHLVVTSGDDGTIPSGLPVGKITSIKKKHVWVELDAQYDTMKFLRVLHSKTPPPEIGEGVILEGKKQNAFKNLSGKL
jgi:rod shape-determining protein MreC